MRDSTGDRSSTFSRARSKTDGIARSRHQFRRLNDLAIRHQGSFFLTYHRFATAEQILACYPQFPEFLRLKRHFDPAERIQSDWYRHYKRMFPN